MAKVLIIEDELELLEMISEYCSEVGHNCYSADSIMTAIEAIEKFTTDIIFLDVLINGKYATDILPTPGSYMGITLRS